MFVVGCRYDQAIRSLAVQHAIKFGVHRHWSRQYLGQAPGSARRAIEDTNDLHIRDARRIPQDPPGMIVLKRCETQANRHSDLTTATASRAGWMERCGLLATPSSAGWADPRVDDRRPVGIGCA